MKKTLSLLVVAALLLALVPAPAIGVDDAVPSSPLSRSAPAEDPSRSDPPGELIIADVLFLRTAGLVACVIGAVGALVVWPFAAASRSENVVCRQLLVKPFRYTFERPLGQMDWPESADDPSL